MCVATEEFFLLFRGYTRQFSCRPVYQGRASIISPRRKPRADDDRDLDI